MKDNNEEKDIELQIILKKSDTRIVKELKKILSKKEVEDLYVDLGQGDKFIIQGINLIENNHAIEFQLSKHCVRWVEMGVKHPIKLTNSE